MNAGMKLKGGETLKITGKIDKIEKIKGGGIRVVDYKTGKTYKKKSKSQKEDLERQLVFYKFLVDKFFGYEWHFNFRCGY